MPLVALKNEIKKYAYQLEESDRHSQDYYCPICKDPFSVVLPIKDFSRIPHFRHKNETYHGEPETQDHVDMKNYFYMAAKELGLDAELEVRIITDFTHIADVIIKYENDSLNTKGIAIECQCSPISVDELIERNQTYLFNGYTPVWVFGSNYYDTASDEKYHLIKKVEKEVYNHHNAIFYFNRYNIEFAYFIYKTNWKGNYVLNHLDFETFIKNVSGHNLSNRIKQHDLNPKNRVGAFYYKSEYEPDMIDAFWVPLIRYPYFETTKLYHKGKFVGKVQCNIDPEQDDVYELVFINASLKNRFTNLQSYRWLTRHYNVTTLSEYGHCKILINKSITTQSKINEMIRRICWVYSTNEE